MYLKYVCEGKKNLSIGAAGSVAAAMGLVGFEQTYFVLLVSYAHAKNDETKRAAFEERCALAHAHKVRVLGNEEFNYFLSVLFPEDCLMILPYNRVVRDLNGMTSEEFLTAISKDFTVRKIGAEAYAPAAKGTFGMFLDDTWYELSAKSNLMAITDPVESLDVSLLQDYLLGPILGIGDPRVDKRIDFIGGIRGLAELERRVHTDMKVAFSMYPTQITELFDVADAGRLMPPKSTWFEPKLRSGLFIHKLS